MSEICTKELCKYFVRFVRYIIEIFLGLTEQPSVRKKGTLETATQGETSFGLHIGDQPSAAAPKTEVVSCLDQS